MWQGKDTGEAEVYMVAVSQRVIHNPTGQGLPVLYLKRISMGSLVLDEELAAGAYRALSEHELAGLRNIGQQRLARRLCQDG